MLVALTAGFGLGTWLLLHATVGAPLPADRWPALVQVHGHAQLVGFAGLLVMGFGYRILPRFRGAPDPPVAPVAASFVLVAGGLVLRAAQAWPELPARPALLLASGALELAGAVVYAGLALGTLGRGQNAHRADELLLGSGAIWFPIGAAWGLVALVPAIGGALVVEPAADAAAIAALLLGFVGAHILGVSLRVAPAFIAARPAPDDVVRAGAMVWTVGVFGMVLGSAAGPILLAAAGIALTWAVGPFGRGVAVRPVPPAARATVLAFRGAYAWLVVGLALLALDVLAGDGARSLGAAARHALAIGFLAQIVYGVGARLVPALTGGTAVPPAAIRWAILLTNVAAALRVGLEIVGPTTSVAAAGLAASGPLALAGLLVFIVAAGRSMRSAVSAFA